MSLAEGVPTVELRDVEASGTQGWSFLNRATMLVVDGPGDEGFLVRRLERDGADLAPPGWDDAVASHGSVAVIASGTSTPPSSTGEHRVDLRAVRRAPRGARDRVRPPAAPDAWLGASEDQRSHGGTDRRPVPPHRRRRHAALHPGHLRPVRDREGKHLVWSVWCSLSTDNMRTTVEHWNDPERSALPPMFGWLNTEDPYDATTLDLPTRVHTRVPGVVPLVEPDPAMDHPLVREHREGITWHRVAELNDQLLGTTP